MVMNIRFPEMNLFGLYSVKVGLMNMENVVPRFKTETSSEPLF